MTDKHLNENTSLNASGNPCCFNFDKKHFNTKELSLFSDIMLLFLNGYHGNNKNITVVFEICQAIRP